MIVADDLDAEISRLELELIALKRARADRQDAELLLTIGRVVPAGVVFSVPELIEHAGLDPELATTIRSMTPKALGRRLARIARHPVAVDLRLECLGRDEHGCIWVVRLTA